MLKTVSSLGNIIGALVYKGTWDASTNTPTLASGVGSKGDYYVVSVAGSTNLDGITDWQVNDIAVFNGSAWQKIDNTDAVLSVNGQTGVVVLGATDVGATPNTAYVLAGTGMTGGGQLTGNVTITLANTAVVAGTYGNATAVGQVTVDAQGRVTSASNVSIAISNTAVSGLGTMSTQNANAVAITGGTVNGITGNVVGAIPSSTVTNALLQNSTATLGNATITLGGTTSSVGNLTLSNVTVSSGNVTANVSLTNATNASATFATSSLPLVPAGYLKFQLANSTVVLVPYYAQ
jgi:hypothetical protein